MRPGQFARKLDGSSDYYNLASDLTGNADSKEGNLSLWFRIDGGDGTHRTFISGVNSKFLFVIQTDNKLRVYATTAVPAVVLRVATNTTYLAGSGWHHVLTSWNLATPEIAYAIDDAIVAHTETTLVDGTIDYTITQWRVGRDTGGLYYLPGAVSELYFEPGDNLDPAVEADRRKFISASGKPVNLGPDGSWPTGTAPIIYAPDGNPANNKGTGGNFTAAGAPAKITGPGGLNPNSRSQRVV